MDLFKAVNQWATRKTETEEKTPDGALKRQVLGEEIVKAIRFPLMSQREFASAVLDSGILTDKEREGMMKYYSNVSTVPLPFLEVKRQQINFPRCHRFLEFRSPCGGSYGDWRYDGHVTGGTRSCD